MKLSSIVLLTLLAVGCSKSANNGDNDSGQAADMRVADSGSDLSADIGADSRSDMVVAPSYVLSRELPDTEELGSRRDLRVVRGIIHAHNIYSHDACDGNPRLEDGSVNEPCVRSFRDAICATRQDFVFMSDHEELMAYEDDFSNLLLLRDDDEAIQEDGAPTANRVMCPDGFRPTLMPGGEFGVMPIGMKRHEAGDAAARDSAYNEETPARVQALKDLGAVVLQAHAESRDRDQLRAQNLDGFEVYQLHANIGPDIREDYLGLDPFGFIDEVTPFIRDHPAPDLAFLGFVSENEPSIAHFDALVSEGQHLVGTGGTDCHQNVLKLKMTDDERVDSYRRMMRWFTNHLLVPDREPESFRQALRDARLYIAFEALGTPADFDFFASNGGATFEMGETATAGSTLHLNQPEIVGNEGFEVPTRVEILRIEASGAVVVAESADGDLQWVADQPGAYRAKVYIQPEHLREHLGESAAELADREYVWIWANPVYVGL